jgi:hypothetical protein
VIAPDDLLSHPLPLPLAQPGRRAHNAKSALERHQAAFYLWEAALKLLGTVCVVEDARLGGPEAGLDDCLQNLARPSLGHWWELVRRLTPVLADRGAPGFGAVRELLLGRRRDDLPRAAGLAAALRQARDGRAAAQASLDPAELFDRLVSYRNREISRMPLRDCSGSGASGQCSASGSTRPRPRRPPLRTSGAMRPAARRPGSAAGRTCGARASPRG